MSGHAKAAALREKANSSAETFQARPIYLRDRTTHANIDIRLLDIHIYSAARTIYFTDT
jgi:hypothetical protein